MQNAQVTSSRKRRCEWAHQLILESMRKKYKRFIPFTLFPSLGTLLASLDPRNKNAVDPSRATAFLDVGWSWAELHYRQQLCECLAAISSAERLTVQAGRRGG